MSVTSASESHASSTSSMSAMSAIEQPALRSGRITRWWSPVRMSADSAMKCTPQNTMWVGLGTLLGQHGQPVRVAAGVGPTDDLVSLVVVTEDEQPVAEAALALAMRSARSSVDAAVYRSWSGVWSRSMVVATSVEVVPVGGRWGQPGRLSHGDVVPGIDMQPDAGPA